MYCYSKPGCKNCCVSHALTPLIGSCATDYVLNPAFVLKVLAQLVKPHNADADTASIMVLKCVLMHSIGVRVAELVAYQSAVSGNALQLRLLLNTLRKNREQHLPGAVKQQPADQC